MDNNFFKISVFNYHNYLAWTYKFSKSFLKDESVIFNNSDLSASVHLRRTSTPYLPYLPFTYTFLPHNQLFNLYILLDSKKKFPKLAKLSNSNLFVYDFRVFASSFSLFSIFKKFPIIFSTHKLDRSEKLLFVGSYDPTNNNLYDPNFLTFLSNLSSTFNAFFFLTFFRNFFLFSPFEVFFKFFISTLSLYFKKNSL